jgi:hypothetical protein
MLLHTGKLSKDSATMSESDTVLSRGAKLLSSSPQAANNIATISMDPIAALRLPPWWPCALGNKLPSAVRQDDSSRNFFTNASKRCLSKENVIYFHPKKSKTSPKHRHKSRSHITDG